MMKLKKYNEKRNFNKTKEPIGKKEVSKRKLRFVVQHHLSRKEHYDFRLEWNGTLISFAIPKGPSYNPNNKRLAIHVEDHPLAYRNFEGTIPKGEYGGGTVMVWDEGFWTPLENAEKSFKNGSIKFLLFGKRLKGKWTLVNFKDNNWLLIKEKDELFLFDNINEFKTSIKTGRTMEEIEKNIKPHPKNSKKENIIENVKITNQEKIIYDKPKITKMDLISYYNKVKERMLPFIETRIISTIRAPEGSKNDCFFKKHLETKSEGIGKIIIPNEKAHRKDYYYIKDIQGLLSEVQMNSYDFHIWGSRIPNINCPDILVFDLDPDDKISLKKN